MEDKKIENIDEIIFQTTVDVENLKQWFRNDDKGLPVHSYLSLYEACGIIEAVQKYVDEHPGFEPVCFDNIQCNAYTNAVLKNFIKEQWQSYSLKLTGDDQVEWDETKYAKGIRHYKKNLSKKIEAALSLDFANYCPGWDDDLQDNVIVFKVWHKNIIEDPQAEKAELIN